MAARLKIAAVDDVIDRSLHAVLSADGYSIYLLHPDNNKDMHLVAAGKSWIQADAECRKLRRILANIIGAAIGEYLR